ncbi:MAG: ChbG/HpnK family deacetylase [Caldilineaceae bacterium]
MNTNQLLGYPADARLLIINADDFGFCHSINEAIIGTMEHGIVQSTTLMVPCYAAQEAIAWLQQHPQVPFGIHLTVLRDTLEHKYGPLTDATLVPSLVDEAGYFYDFERMATLRAKAKLAELEQEFRAQIETVLAANLRPTHLDWHSLRFGERLDILDLMTSLAKEYGLAQRMIGQSTIDKVQAQGLPTIDFDFLDSCSLDVENKLDHVGRLLKALPAGLSEWAVHPGLGEGDLAQIQPTMIPIRQSDYDTFVLDEVAQLIAEEGITLLDYRPLQRIWSASMDKAT